jgi:hypothetical protein
MTTPATPGAMAAPIHSSNRTRVAVNALPCGGREIVTTNTALSLQWVNGTVWIAFNMRTHRALLPAEVQDWRARRRAPGRAR